MWVRSLLRRVILVVCFLFRHWFVLSLHIFSLSSAQEYPTLTTFFAGEIISRKRPFLTRKWDADEDVDRKHWVGILKGLEVSKFLSLLIVTNGVVFFCFARASFRLSTSTQKASTRTTLTTKGWRTVTLSSWDGRYRRILAECLSLCL